MLTLLLGPDDYSKRQYIAKLEQSLGIGADFFVDTEILPAISSLASADLFAKTKIYTLKNMITLFKSEEILTLLAVSKNHIFFIEEKLDKRSSDTKKLLTNKDIQVKEFALPHGRELDDWLIKRAAVLGVTLLPDVADTLAVALGRDNAKEIKVGGKVVAVQEVYNLWQAENELQKLICYASGAEITNKTVECLVKTEVKIEALEIANYLADNNRLAVLSLVEEFLVKESAGDVKAGIIQLSALLAEQFRNIVMIQDFLKRKFSDQQILDVTSWRSGRLFMVKKAANNFSNQRVKDFLIKLQALDVELKSSTLPPRVLLDLILSQLLSTP